MDYKSRITSDPRIRNGIPCVKGTSIAVMDILDNLANGLTFEAVLKKFPELVNEDIRACLQFAASFHD